MAYHQLVRELGSYDLGQAWAGNSVNCVPYRNAPMLRRSGADLVSFYDAKGSVVLAKCGNGCKREVIENERLPHDAHQAISIGMNASGYIHLAFGAHDSTILLVRSRRPGLSGGFDPATATFLQSAHADDQSSLTYPMFLNVGDEFLLLYRSGSSSNGAIYVSRFCEVTQNWKRDNTPIISGMHAQPPSGPYLNTPMISTDGTITCFLVWRLPLGATSAGAVVNVGIDCFRSTDGLRTAETLSGVKFLSGVTPTCTERVVAVPLGAGLINQSSAAVMPDGRVAVISYWAGKDGVPQYRMAWPTDRGWRISQLSKFKTRFSLDGGGTLPLPHSRPELLFDDYARAYVIFRSAERANQLVLRVFKPPDYSLSGADEQILVAEDLGFYEPVLSRSAWVSDRQIVLFVQNCQQHVGRDGLPSSYTSLARLYRWESALPQSRLLSSHVLRYFGGYLGVRA